MSEVNNKDHMQCFTTCLMNKARKEFYSNFIAKIAVIKRNYSMQVSAY